MDNADRVIGFLSQHDANLESDFTGWTVTDLRSTLQNLFGPIILMVGRIFPQNELPNYPDAAYVSGAEALGLISIMTRSGSPSLSLVVSDGDFCHSVVPVDVDWTRKRLEYLDPYGPISSLLSEGRNRSGVKAYPTVHPGRFAISFDEFECVFFALPVPASIYHASLGRSLPVLDKKTIMGSSHWGNKDTLELGTDTRDSSRKCAEFECVWGTVIEPNSQTLEDIVRRSHLLLDITTMISYEGLNHSFSVKLAELFRRAFEDLCSARAAGRESQDQAVGRIANGLLQDSAPAARIFAFVCGFASYTHIIGPAYTVLGTSEERFGEQIHLQLVFHQSHYPCSGFIEFLQKDKKRVKFGGGPAL